MTLTYFFYVADDVLSHLSIFGHVSLKINLKNLRFNHAFSPHFGIKISK